MKSTRWVRLGLGFASLTAITAIALGPWLNEQIIRPLAVAWLWLIFYLIHLPQMAVWGGVLTLLGLAGIKALGLKRPQLRAPSPRQSANRPRGPVSQWQQRLGLAMQGSLYRHKLRGHLLALKKGEVSTTTTQFLDGLRQPQRTHVNVFSNALNQTLDELAPNGDHHEHFRRGE